MAEYKKNLLTARIELVLTPKDRARDVGTMLAAVRLEYAASLQKMEQGVRDWYAGGAALGGVDRP